MKNLPLPLLLLPLLALLAASACRNTFERERGPEPEDLFQLYATTATYLYEDGSLARAQDQAVKALEIEPDDPAMRRMIGWIRLRMGTPEDLIIAERFFRDLLRERDESETTRLGLATTLERLGKGWEEAARAFERGERTPPNGSDPRTAAREARQRARAAWQEAIELYRSTFQGGEEGTGSATAMNGLQRVHALLGDYEESLRWSRRLLERTEEELSLWRRLLTESAPTESEERAYRENERAAGELRLETHLFAATLLNKLGREREAIGQLDAAAKERPDLAQVYSLRAQLLAERGEWSEAIADLDRFLRLSEQPFEHPDVRRALELRSRCEAAIRDPESSDRSSAVPDRRSKAATPARLAGGRSRAR